MRPSCKARGESIPGVFDPADATPSAALGGMQRWPNVRRFCNEALAAGQPEHHRDEDDAVDGSLGARLVKPQLLVDRHRITR